MLVLLLSLRGLGEGLKVGPSSGEMVPCFSWLLFWANLWLFIAWPGARRKGYLCVSLALTMLLRIFFLGYFCHLFWCCISFSLAVTCKQPLPLLLCILVLFFPPEELFSLPIFAHSPTWCTPCCIFLLFFKFVSALVIMYIVVQHCSVEGSVMLETFCICSTQSFAISRWY